MRDIITIIGLLSFSINLFAQSANPTAPHALLEKYAGDFTDSDKDGMTDVAELRYGYNPYTADLPSFDLFLEMDEDVDISEDENIGSDSDVIYFKFQNFNETQANKTRNFINKLIPIMYDIVGNPAESFVCTFYNRGGWYGSWQAVNKGRKMLCDDSWNPRLMLHELIHVWKGKYGFASKGHFWRFEKNLSGFEEGCEGIAYEILHDYIEAYPTDSVSVEILEGGAWDNWSNRASNFDVVKHQRYTGGGDFWIDNISHYDRYNISAVLMQIFQKHDPNFFKKTMKKYYELIESDSDWRPNRHDLIDLWASIVPELNGIPTKTYLNAMPILNGKQLDSEFYAISISDARFSYGGSQKIYCAFADSNRGEFWWSSPIKHSTFSKYGIPSWFGKYLGDDGYYYTDNRNQPYRILVKDVFGNTISDVSGTLNNPTDETDGSPSTIATARPSILRGDEHEIGLYTYSVEFPNYKNFTDKYKQDYYFFGYKSFSQSRTSDYSIFVGIDAPIKSTMQLVLNGKTYKSTIDNGCGVFMLNDQPVNLDGVFEISVSSEETTNVYKRTLINGGTSDNYRHQTFLIIDKDFDGIEDIYEYNEKIIAYDNTDDNSSGTLNLSLRISEETESGDINSTEFITENINEEQYENEVYADINQTEPFTESVASVSDQFVFEMQIALEGETLKISWNTHQNLSHFLKLHHGDRELIYGGHYNDYAIVDLHEFQLNGTEILEGAFLEYDNEGFSNYINEFTLNLSDYFSVEPIIVQVETNNSTVIVDDVVAVEIDESNTTIINTTDNVVLIQNTESITEYNDDTVISDEETIVVIADNNITVYTEEHQYESNATDSVVTITEESISIEDDSAKFKFGGDSPDAPPTLQSAWNTAIAIGNHWYYLEWFGYFFRAEGTNWIFHEQLGWMFTDWTTSFDSVWIYSDSFGWMWTNKNTFSYMYNPYSSTWIYLADGGYYDFSKNEWVKL